MKKIINKILFIFLCIVIFLINTTTCNAKSYSVKNASFNVELLEDGSAIITESWDLDFDGEYSRFYKEIYTNLSKAECFDNFNVINVTIDGVEAIEVDNQSERIDNTYRIVKENDLIRIEWFKHVNTAKVNYQITYKIDNIVKATDYNKALFSYRFVGKNFDKKIENAKLTINTLSNENINIDYYTGFNNYYINGKTIVLTGTDQKGLHKVNILMDLVDYESLNYVQISSLPEENLYYYISMLIPIIIFTIIVLTVVIGILLGKKEDNKINNFVENNPHYMKDLFRKYDSYGLDAIDVSIMYDNPLDIYTLLNLFFLYLNSKEKCTITDETIILNKDVINNNDLYKKIINELFTVVDYEEKSGTYIIKLDSLTSRLKESRKLRGNITNIYIKYRKTRKYEIKEKYIQKESDNYRFLSKLVDKLPEYDSKCTYDYYSVAKKTPIEIDKVYSIVFKRFSFRETTIVEKIPISLMAFCQLSDDYYNKLNASTSSSMGCSSCSSCSGCGGGGAD